MCLKVGEPPLVTRIDVAATATRQGTLSQTVSQNTAETASRPEVTHTCSAVRKAVKYVLTPRAQPVIIQSFPKRRSAALPWPGSTPPSPGHAAPCKPLG